MKKVLIIEGDRNIKKIIPEQLNTIRKESIKWSFPDEYYESNKQAELVQKLYLDIDTDHNHECTEKKALLQMIQKKASSYKQQDIGKEIYSDYYFIDNTTIIEKLVESKMRCKYCKDEMFLIYKTIREPKQWTLDRIDNDCGHNKNNVVISCLQCNLKRRRTNMDKFLFTKQLKISREGLK